MPRRPRPRPLLALALALAPAAVAAAAVVDVPAQLYLLGARSPPDAPRSLSAVLERQLNGSALSDLSFALQRALLWDAGWLRLSGYSTTTSSSSSSSSSSTSSAWAEYVQVLVPCGKGMDDVFLSTETLDEHCEMESECRRPPGANTSAWSCSSSRDMATIAQCAVLLSSGSLSGSGAAAADVENASWPAVASSSTIDSSFDPQVFRFVNTTEETDGGDDDDAVLLIAARGSWRGDSASFCFQAPLFATPCRVLAGSAKSSGSGSSSDWCEPGRLGGVSDWLAIELAELASTEQRVSGVSGESSSSSSSGDGNDSALLIGIIAAVMVLVIIISAPFWIARRNQRASRHPPASRHQRSTHHRPPHSRSEHPLSVADRPLTLGDFRLLTDR